MTFRDLKYRVIPRDHHLWSQPDLAVLVVRCLKCGETIPMSVADERRDDSGCPGEPS